MFYDHVCITINIIIVAYMRTRITFDCKSSATIGRAYVKTKNVILYRVIREHATVSFARLEESHTVRNRVY